MALGFLVVMGSDAVGPVLGLDARSMGATATQIGLMFASLYAVRFVIGPTVGRLSDRVGLRRMLAINLVAGPLIPLAYLIAPTFGWLLAVQILNGVVSSAFSPIVMGYLGTIAERGKEGAVSGLYNTSVWIASSLGVLASGVIATRFGLHAPFVLFLVLSLAGTGVVFLLPDESGMRDDSRPARAAVPERRLGQVGTLRTWLRNPEIGVLLAANFAYYVNTAALFTFFPLFGVARGYSLAEVGLFLSLLGATASLLQLFLGRLSDRVQTGWLLLAGAVLLSIGIGVLLLESSFAIALPLACVIAVGLALMQASVTKAGVVTGRRLDMGAFMGLFYSSQALGKMSGPVLSGLISSGGSSSLVFAPAAALALSVSIAGTFVRGRR